MNALLQALTDAARVEFDAPKCGRCAGAGTTARDEFADATCTACKGKWCAVCSPVSQWCECDHMGRHQGYECPDVNDEPCPACHATGLDASDPHGLIGRALGWLETRACDVLHRWPTNEVIVYWDVPVGAMPPGQVARELVERHNSTPESRATALLRLVARVGTPPPQTAPETREMETT